MLDPALDDFTRKRACASTIDWRNAWAGIRDDGAIVAWPDDAADAVGAERLQVSCVMSPTSTLEPMRREPRHSAEMISEVRSAERLRGLTNCDGWWLVAGEDDYVGWVHEWVLEEAGEDPGPVTWRYGRPLGTLWISDHHAATPLVFGTPLWRADGPLTERGGNHLVRTATGREGWIAGAQLRDPAANDDPREILNLLRGLAGTPYRWGGRSPLGFDCSGLVQFVSQLCGANFPRDASQQAECGEELSLDPAGWQAGDLVFFGDPADHVGFVDGRGHLLHCRGQVRQDRIDDIPDLMARISSARRWTSMRGRGAPRNWTAPVQ